MADTRTIREIKYAPGHKAETWECEVIKLDAPASVRVKCVNDTEFTIEGVTLPVGTVINAAYWRDRPYHVWQFSSPDGSVYGYRYNVSMHTHIWQSKFIWTDLGYMLWVPTGGDAVWKELDEVQQLLRLEHLAPEEAQVGENGRERLDSEWKDVIEEVYAVRW
jgi:hypothetical protein